MHTLRRAPARLTNPDASKEDGKGDMPHDDPSFSEWKIGSIIYAGFKRDFAYKVSLTLI